MRPIDGDALEKYLSDAEIEAIRQRKYVFASALNTICGNVRNFPTIEPERKKGKWIDPGYDSIFTYVKSYAKCDQCGKVVNYGREMNFCPNCGSDMRGNQDENN